jgi:RNA polymerase sigma-70 factor, ECF subfamily
MTVPGQSVPDPTRPRPDRHERERLFRDLVDQVHDPVHRYLVRRCPASDVDDVLADVLLVLWRRLDEVPADRPLAWCYGVARRVLANLRRAHRRRDAVVERVIRLAPPTSVPGPDAGEDTAPDHLTAALGALRENDRELLRLWAWEHLGPADIAAVLGISANAAAIRLHRAKGRLRDAIAMKELREWRTETGRGEEDR